MKRKDRKLLAENRTLGPALKGGEGGEGVRGSHPTGSAERRTTAALSDMHHSETDENGKERVSGLASSLRMLFDDNMVDNDRRTN